MTVFFSLFDNNYKTRFRTTQTWAWVTCFLQQNRRCASICMLHLSVHTTPLKPSICAASVLSLAQSNRSSLLHSHIS